MRVNSKAWANHDKKSFAIGFLFFFCAFMPVRAQNKPENMGLSELADTMRPIEPFKIDLSVEKKFDPYMLVTHNNTIYKGTFILVLKKLKPAQEKNLRAAIARSLNTDAFSQAPILVAIDAYAQIFKDHPNQAERVKRDYAQTYLNFTKDKIKAIAFRPAKDETEGTLR